MNWAALAAFAACGSILVSLVVGAVIYGRLTERVDGNTLQTEAHAAWLGRHDEKLQNHGERIVRVEEWKDGLRTGMNGPSFKDV